MQILEATDAYLGQVNLVDTVSEPPKGVLVIAHTFLFCHQKHAGRNRRRGIYRACQRSHQLPGCVTGKRHATCTTGKQNIRADRRGRLPFRAALEITWRSGESVKETEVR
ncbi:hypothetical protein D9M71_625660 [compost metagenome]